MYFLPHDSKWYQSLASVKSTHRYWYTTAIISVIAVFGYGVYWYYDTADAQYKTQLQAVQKQIDTVSNARERIKQLEHKKNEQLKAIEQQKTRLQSVQVKDIIALIYEVGISLGKCSMGRQINKQHYSKLPINITMTATVEQLSQLSKKLSQKGVSLTDITLSASNEPQHYSISATIALYEGT